MRAGLADMEAQIIAELSETFLRILRWRSAGVDKVSVNFPHFDPEGIAVALYNQLLTANGTNPGQYKFVKTDQRGDIPQKTCRRSIKPYMALVEFRDVTG